MKIKLTTAFRALNAARANRAKEAKRFMVKSLNKDGSISRAAPTKLAWQHNAFEDEAAAEARRADLEKMNPGLRFVVVAL